jgi:hypothetical protein
MKRETKLATLVGEYQTFLKSNGLAGFGSADALLSDERLNSVQRAWLVDFYRRWETATTKR